MEKYLDFYHVENYSKIKKAFDEFNSALIEIDPALSFWVESVVVKADDVEYAKVGYIGGDLLLEPLFNPVRHVDDR